MITKIAVGDYVSHIVDVENIALVLEYYTPEEWAVRQGYEGHVPPEAVCRIQWLSSILNPNETSKEYWWADVFIKVEENLETYYGRC